MRKGVPQCSRRREKRVCKAVGFGFGTSYGEWVCMPEIISVVSEGDGWVGEVCKAVDYFVHGAVSCIVS